MVVNVAAATGKPASVNASAVSLRPSSASGLCGIILTSLAVNCAQAIHPKQLADVLDLIPDRRLFASALVQLIDEPDRVRVASPDKSQALRCHAGEGAPYFTI
jgi:hypothetical protein